MISIYDQFNISTTASSPTVTTRPTGSWITKIINMIHTNKGKTPIVPIYRRIKTDIDIDNIGGISTGTHPDSKLTE